MDEKLVDFQMSIRYPKYKVKKLPIDVIVAA